MCFDISSESSDDCLCRLSDSVRALLLSAASTDSVTETDVQMLINTVQQFTEVVATAVIMSSTCESLTYY